jgi:cation:H+ antiporter
LHTDLVILLVGLIGIWYGAGLVVHNGQRIAKALNLSEAFIGLTVLSIGTSLPEMFTHIAASIDVLNGMDASGVALGTNVGSNIIQITLIIGVVGLFTLVKSNKRIIRFDYIVMLGSIVLLWLVSLNHYISRLEGAVLFLLYVYYMWFLLRREKIIEKNPYQTNYWVCGALIVTGIGILIFAANMVVDKAVFLSRLWNIEGSLIGTLMIGVSTALPELTTALRAVLKGSASMSLGTLVGSNITNPLMMVGLGAMISGYTVDNYLLWFDIPVWFLVSVVCLLFFWKDSRLHKHSSIILIGMYLLYVFVKIRMMV